MPGQPPQGVAPPAPPGHAGARCKDQAWSPKCAFWADERGGTARARARAQTGSLAPQAHVYSLGATLRAALEYVAEPAPRLSRDLEALLGQMQAEDPAHRPDLEVTGSRPLSLP